MAKSKSEDQNELEEVIARLSQEAREAYEAGKCGAFALGAEWAKGAPLAELRRVCEFDGEQEDESLQDLVLGTACNDCNCELREQAEDEGHDFGYYAAGYMDGFQEGARSVWEKVGPVLP